MNSFFLHLLMGGQQATAEGAQSGGPLGGGWMTFLPFIAIIAIFYFLIIRPQNKKQKETQKMLAALKKGDKIVTIGGIHGTIQSVRESTVVVKVCDGAKIEFSRNAISGIETAAKEDKSGGSDNADEKAESDEKNDSSNDDGLNAEK